MSRVFTAVLVLVAGFCANALASEVNLDKPGALEALKRDKPAHYSRVMEAVAKARSIDVDAAPTSQNANLAPNDPRMKGATAVLPSDPAKKRLAVRVGDVTYRVTAHLTERPGQVEKAK
jgi:hypothetical protein